MKKVILTSMLLFVGILTMGIAQAQTVSGTVTEENGPLPGASVVVKGTSNGTSTDFDGNYTLNNVPSDAVLVFSYVGFSTQEIAVGGRSSIAVTMATDNALDEVVLIGYGSTRIKDATGSVAVVSSEEFNTGVIASPEQLLQGKVAGVSISEASGEPGAAINFNIRGSNSIRSGNNPLFVVDGVPLGGGGAPAVGVGGVGGANARNPLSFLNPNDIESISILRDASATAIYGARAANGVVLIQTKAGRGARKGVWEFNTSLSTSFAPRTFDLLNADEFREGRIETEQFGIAPLSLDGGENNNFQEFALRTASSRRTDLSYSKNWGTGNIRTSVTYSNQNGIIQQLAQERIAGRVNVAQKFLDDKLSVDFQGTISRVNDTQAPLSGGAGSVGDFFSASLTTNPTLSLDPDATFGFENRFNPANLIENFRSVLNNTRFLANLSVGYQFTPELSAKVFGSYDYSDGQAIAAFTPEVFGVANISGFGDVQFNTLENENTQLDITINFVKEWGNFKLDLLGGYSFQRFDRNGFNSQGRGLRTSNLDAIFDNVENQFDIVSDAIGQDFQQFGFDTGGQNFFGTFNPNAANQEDIFPNFDLPGFERLLDAYTALLFDNSDDFVSFFLRSNFSFAEDKYNLTATARYDGSTLFGEDNQFDFFPSAAFAWNLHNEDFVGENVSTLKIRAGAGLVGNSQGLTFGNAFFRQNRQFTGFNGATTINGPGIQFIGNNEPDLQFETTFDLNLGVDFGFNNDRFNGSFNIYRRATDDLLLPQVIPAPQVQGVEAVFGNIDEGTVINQGVELQLGYDFVQTDDWTFGANFNISYNDNELQDFTVETPNGTEDAPLIQAGPINGNGLTNAFAQAIGNNQPLFSFFTAPFEGLDDDGNPVFGEAGFSDRSALPSLNGGLSLYASYKNWSLNTFFNYQGDFYVYNATDLALFSPGNFAQTQNVPQSTLNAILGGENVAGTVAVSDRFLERGDFLRLQNATLAYDWPLSDDNFLDALRLSITGQNLFLITGYSGLDPEVSVNTGFINAQAVPTRGIDLAQVPRPTTITLGLNARF